MSTAVSPLLTDLYQLNMVEAYLADGQTKSAVFEFAIRRLPDRRGFLLAAGLEQALQFLETFRYPPDELRWLGSTGRFSKRLLDYLAALRFTGDVHAMPEGTVFFANEPILRITAPLPEAQLLETRLINLLHFETLIASKAARMMLAAPGKQLVDFGLRRAHAGEAGLLAARASYIAGFAGTATVEAERQFAIPIFGTMAHSLIEAYDDEATAFERFARARPENLTFLLDTYDSEAAAGKVVALAPKLAALGITIRAVRLDSGNLAVLSRSIRGILDDGGLKAVSIIASGGLDEDILMSLTAGKAPIDGYGIGTSLTTSADVPALDCAYKLQEYAGLPRRKQSLGKATWPGRKQVWRRLDQNMLMIEDIVATEGEKQDGAPLVVKVMTAGKRVGDKPSLDDIRARAAREIERLPESLRRLQPGAQYPVTIADSLQKLAAEADRRIAGVGKATR